MYLERINTITRKNFFTGSSLIEGIGVSWYLRLSSEVDFFSPDEEKYFCVSCSFAFLASNWIIAAEADVGKRLIEIQTRRKFKKIPTGRQLVRSFIFG